MIKNIEQKISGAVLTAFDEYHRMTDGHGGWINSTPEYWYTVAIARRLYNSGATKKTNYVTLENPVSEILDWAKECLNPSDLIYEKLRPTGQVDILLWNQKGKKFWKPRAIVEVKVHCGGETVSKLDVDRILSGLVMMGKKVQSGTLKAGYFVLLSDAKRTSQSKKDVKEELTRRFNEVVKNIKKQSDNFSESAGLNFATKFEVSPHVKFGDFHRDSQAAVLVVKIKISD